jgi:ATP-dependent Clp protease protease subunit
MAEKARRVPRIFARLESQNGRKRGVLHLYDAFGWGGIRANDVVEKLEALKDEGAEDLDIRLNSPGGDVFAGNATYSAIASWPYGEKRVHIDGLAASIASVIAMAGDEIEISPSAMVMIHAPLAHAEGTAGDLRKMADRLDAIQDVMCGIYVQRTGLPAAEVEKLVEAETWMSAAEAVERGFAGKIAPIASQQSEPDEPDEDGGGGADPDTDGDDKPEDSLTRAMALFKRAPPGIAKLLNVRCAASAADAKPPKENPMPQPVSAPETTAAMPAAAAAAPAMTAAPAVAAAPGAFDTRVFDVQIAALTARAQIAERGQAELLGATGKASVGEAVAMVAGLKEKAMKADELAGYVAKLEAEKRAAEVKDLLDGASQDGRLTPAKREELMKADAPAFARDPMQLQVFLDCLQPVVVPAAAPKHLEPAKEPVAVLTEDEQHFAEQLKLEPKAVAEYKAKKK